MDFVPGEVLVGYSEAASQREYSLRASALAEKVNATVVKQFADLVLLQTGPTEDVARLAALLQMEPGVACAQPNFIANIPEENPPGPAVEIREFIRGNPSGDTQAFSVNLSREETRTTAWKAYPDDEWANWGNEWIGHDLIWPEKNRARWCA